MRGTIAVMASCLLALVVDFQVDGARRQPVPPFSVFSSRHARLLQAPKPAASIHAEKAQFSADVALSPGGNRALIGSSFESEGGTAGRGPAAAPSEAHPAAAMSAASAAATRWLASSTFCGDLSAGPWLQVVYRA